MSIAETGETSRADVYSYRLRPSRSRRRVCRLDLINVPEVFHLLPSPAPRPGRMKGERVGIHIPTDLFRCRTANCPPGHHLTSHTSLTLFLGHHSQKKPHRDSYTFLVLPSLTYETRVGPRCRSKLPSFTASSSFERKRTVIAISFSPGRTGSRLTSTITTDHQPEVTRHSNRIRQPRS